MLSPVVWVKDQCVGWWQRYMALIDVAEENERLRDELRHTRMLATISAEDEAELARLRRILQLEALRERPAFAARVIARRFGPMSIRKTFTVNKGFLDGAVVGTPAVTQAGVVGRVMRSAPHAATVLMVTDSGFRVSVISQESRTPGILTGSAGGAGVLEVSYVAQTARLEPGELLITAGSDNDFPKGIPVGVVTRVEPGNETLFQRVQAQAMADLDRLEEVLLIEQEGPPLVPTLPGPPEPDVLLPRPAPAQPGSEQSGPEPGPEQAVPGQPRPGQTAPPEGQASPARPREPEAALASPSPAPPRDRARAGERPAAVLDSLQPAIPLTAPLAPPAP